MSVSKSPKNKAEPARGAAKEDKEQKRPSRSALGEALRANLRRRKDQARARAADEPRDPSRD